MAFAPQFRRIILSAVPRVKFNVVVVELLHVNPHTPPPKKKFENSKITFCQYRTYVPSVPRQMEVEIVQEI
jgi:hypothetical protein